MTLNKEQLSELLEASKPLIKWLNENCHPHCSAIVGSIGVRLVEGISSQTTFEFVKD